MNKRGFVFILFLLVLCMPVNVHAIMFYDSESDFLANATIASTETFDSYSGPVFFNTPEVIFNDVHYYTEGYTTHIVTGARNYWEIYNGFGIVGYATPPNSLFANAIAPQTISFGEHNFVKAFGVWMSTPANDPTSQLVSITEINGKVSTYELITNGPTQQYFGISSNPGISKIDLGIKTLHNGAANWSFDNVSRSAIRGNPTVTPEPATLLLMGGGLAGAIWRRRKVSNL